MTRTNLALGLIVGVVYMSFASCSSGGSDSGGDDTAGGGDSASGGASSSGTGGSSRSGGGQASGGGSSVGGSSQGVGGSTGSGGADKTGGGGAKASDAGANDSGTPGSGGRTSSDAGGRGGAVGSGGRSTIDASPGTGGSSGTGGSPTSTACSFPSGWSPASPTYTTYTLPNAATACGYQGNNNTIKNIVTPANFAAIPGNSSSDFNTKDRCGACVKIGSAIVTIVDECPVDGGQNAPCRANMTGHLDLSNAAASAGGVKGDPNVRGQNAWSFVPCPVTGNVVVRLKNGNNNEFFIENEILPIQSVTCAGQTGSRTSYGAWHFDSDVNGQACTVTDISNRTIGITVGNAQGQDVDSGKQFPKCN